MAGSQTFGADGGIPLTLYVHPVIPGGASVALFISNTAAKVYDLATFFLHHPVYAGSACFGAIRTHILRGPVVIQTSAIVFLLYSCYQAYRSFEEAVQHHLDAGRGGTSANAWGWWILWRLRLMGEIPSVFTIRVSPFLKPYRGILHTNDIPTRPGRRPTIEGIAPQRQKDQKTAVNQFELIQNRLRQKAIDYPRDLVFELSFLERLSGTSALKVRRQAHPATPTTLAWSTATPYTSRPERAWIKRFGYEIAHAHHADGSMHVILHPEDVQTVIEQGWGERHLLASTSRHWLFYWDSIKSWWNPESRPPIPETLVFLYAPRDAMEVEYVFRIIDAAIWYITGEEVDSNVGKGTHRKDRYLDEFNTDGTLKTEAELDAGWPSTHLVSSTAAQARKDEEVAFKKAQAKATKPTAGYSSFVNPVPKGLSKAEQSIYDILARVQKNRASSQISPPKIVVITDIAKDYDDLAAMVLLKELHRLGLVKLLGFVANLKPAHKRAIYGRGALDTLGLTDVPIAVGTDGIGRPPRGTEEPSEVHVEHSYEFTGSFYTRLENNPPTLKEGAELLKEICTDAKEAGEKLTFLLLSSLKDISEFSSANEDLFKAVVKNVVLQGGYYINHPLEPDFKAVNNRFDRPAATAFHSFMSTAPIQSAVYTKIAAFATPLTTQLFDDLAATQHVLGQHLKTVQIEQDKEFYRGACTTAQYMTQEFFLRNKTSWYDTHTETDVKPDPETDEIIPYLTKVVVYDALAALGAAGQDILLALGIIKTKSTDLHQAVGTSRPPLNPGIDGEKMAAALSALLKGSLLASKQNLTASL